MALPTPCNSVFNDSKLWALHYKQHYPESPLPVVTEATEGEIGVGVAWYKATLSAARDAALGADWSALLHYIEDEKMVNWHELSSFAKPPTAVVSMCELVLALMPQSGDASEWSKCRKLFASPRRFLEDLAGCFRDLKAIPLTKVYACDALMCRFQQGGMSMSSIARVSAAMCLIYRAGLLMQTYAAHCRRFQKRVL
eukprot:TRINITY_DN15035_c0_g1_i1.p1 TRINITY_DN15035_c0_g1~~TRINITY_DN15035_c0_g1_i1.p1  ORF type:complete len:227 (-),score=26.15 TRINITY_DN15035_c0_g1_i1:47-637(-)